MNALTSTRLLSVALLTATVFLLPACGNGGVVGRWKWVSGTCNKGALFPEKLEFLSNGEYVGQLSYLNGGQYSVVDKQRIKLDTAVGPRVYQFEIVDAVLTLKDDSDCKFSYARDS